MEQRRCGPSDLVLDVAHVRFKGSVSSSNRAVHGFESSDHRKTRSDAMKAEVKSEPSILRDRGEEVSSLAGVVGCQLDDLYGSSYESS